METTVQFRGYDRTKYDLTDPYAQRYMARDRAMEAANVALVASALGWNCTKDCTCPKCKSRRK